VTPPCTIIGIGNLLMGDEGIGVHVVRHLESMSLPADVACIDGGTGGLHLLEPLQQSPRVILIDATNDGGEPGGVRRLRPRYARDYPSTLTAHDIGLKDMLDAMELLEDVPNITLFAVSIAPPGDLSTELSPPLRRRVPEIAAMVLEELADPDPA
jgi:hydrogenase maturation protease